MSATDLEHDRREPPRASGRVAIVLMIASVAASLAVVPFSRTLLARAEIPGLTPSVMTAALVVLVVLESLGSLLAIGVGLRLGSRIGLGAPLLARRLSGDRSAGREIARSIGPALGLGLGLGLFVKGSAAMLAPLLPKARLTLVDPPAWQGLLASIGAGVREEVWMRLGLLTALAWAGTRWAGRTEPSWRVLETANVLAALAFSSLHVPQATALFGLSAPVLAFVLAGNAIPALVFGWLYTRKGLIAAMIAHGAADFVLKVLGRLFS